MRTLTLTISFMLLYCSIGFTQEVELPAQQVTKTIDSLKYSTSGSNELDVEALTQRVDDLTDAVNTHTDQIAELDNRLTILEDADKPTLSMSGGLQSRSCLSSTLNPVGTVRKSSWGSNTGGGSTGNVSKNLTSSSLLSSRIVSVSDPVVTSVRYGEPIVTPTVRYEATPAVQPRPIIQQQPVIVRSAPVMAPLPAAPSPIERRQTVRMPVTRVTTQNVRYEAAPSSGCPGGACPVNRNRGGFLGTGIGSRLGKGWGGGL